MTSSLTAAELAVRPGVDMPRLKRYICTSCGQDYERESLLAKKVSFTQMGAGGKLVRSRVVDWLCPACTVKDDDWNQTAASGSPRSRRLRA